MLKVPYLTDLDSRAAVKGSRDPLGIQQVWTRMGRHVVGNLTTVSNSVRDFSTLLLGYYFAEQLADELGPGSKLATFLKWEQLAAYSRASVNGDFSFRGTERVKRNLSESNRVTLSDERSHQILANQKIYGLWGLYTMPSRASGLVNGSPTRLTPVAMDFVQTHCLPILTKAGAGKDASRIVTLLKAKSTRFDVKKPDAPVVAAGQFLKQNIRKAEREFFYEHLVEGGPTDATEGRQRQLASLLADSLSDSSFKWTPATMRHLVKAASSRGDQWQPLATDLERIRITESVLAPSSLLFNYLLGSDGQTIKEIAGAVEKQWGRGLTTIEPGVLDGMHGQWSGGDSSVGDRWVAIGHALSSGRFADVVEQLMQQNASVMTTRGGAAWVEKNRGKLNVRFKDENGKLPDEDKLGELWRFPYFLDSLRSVVRVLREKSSD
ncbi:hypothetical protein K227x_26180 [Rubripirellula lacrimiformis]|uniref:Uncharacterized protein n=1 Tax=Rubripirellula lacrimiformis TaxID=1930273 RepID=A0A517NB33_9BACT|nr:hypothetical protein [Rubripirellula lacrimiformis]QDT04228.1 hypothetical protein K227x_26180 [Rubripirellula lacrimiformis]